MMALARLGLKNMGQRMVCPFSLSCSLCSTVQKQRWGGSDHHHQLLMRRLSLTASSASASAAAVTGTGDDQKPSKGQVVSVSEGEGRKKFHLSPRKHRKRGLWKRNTDHDNFVPALYEFFPSGLGDALLQATQNINKLLQNLTPSGLIGRVKEQDECYKLRFNVPGLGKEDMKITVEDGVLTIKGEHKEEVEEEEGSDDEQYWSAKSFDYIIDTCIVLPEDAKVEEIKAQMKDGVLTIIIPRTEKPKKDVKEVPIH